MKNVLKEIEERIRKKKLAKQRASYNVSIEGYISSFIRNIEDLEKIYTDKHDVRSGWAKAQSTLVEQLRVFDNGVAVSIKSFTQEDGKRYVDSVTVRWSDKYQRDNNCDPELTLTALDIALSNV